METVNYYMKKNTCGWKRRLTGNDFRYAGIEP